jgi:hypothetical protein
MHAGAGRRVMPVLGKAEEDQIEFLAGLSSKVRDTPRFRITSVAVFRHLLNSAGWDAASPGLARAAERD